MNLRSIFASRQNKLINLMNNRQKQAYAALCLRQFCLQMEIEHPEIFSFMSHLLGMLIAENLVDWETKGTQLHLSGMVDPIPQDIKEVVPKNLFSEFEDLVSFCNEVGVVDMYGADTTKPAEYLVKCIAVLERLGIEAPDPRPLLKFATNTEVWGDPISDAEFRELCKEYDFVE